MVRKAADQGDSEAQLNLGFMYTLGHGVPKNYAAAASWYRKAAEQGHASAQFNLGLMYSSGGACRRTMCRRISGSTLQRRASMQLQK